MAATRAISYKYPVPDALYNADNGFPAEGLPVSMTLAATSIPEVTKAPGMYAMFGGESVGKGWVAYVGIAGNLHPRFEDDDERHASELVAFEVLQPALRSRGRPRQAALAFLDDPAFVDDVKNCLEGPPSGLVLPRLLDLADRVHELEERLRELGKRVP